MHTARKYILYTLDVLIISSSLIILFVLLTGGYKFSLLQFGFTSLERPLFILFVVSVIKRLYSKTIYNQEGLLRKAVAALENYPAKKLKLTVFLITFLLLTIAATKLLPIWDATGDEPHFLMITSSLVNDHDINLRNNYNNKDYTFFYPIALRPHAKIHTATEIYSAHGTGLPLLLTPGYLVGYRTGAVFIIILLASLLSTTIFSLAYAVTEKNTTSICLSLLMIFTTPLFFYSLQLFSELPAALIIAYIFTAVFIAKEQQLPKNKTLFIGILLAFLPWLHIRYIFFTVIFLVYLSLNLKHKTRLLLPISLSIILLLLYMKTCFGEFSFTAQYFAITAGFHHLFRGIIGNFIDRQFGLFVYSPYYIFIGAGLFYFWKVKRRLFLLWSITVIPFIIIISSYYEWYGGYCPPLRYMIPVVPLLIVPLAYLFQQNKHWLFLSIFTGLGCYSLYIKNFLLQSPDTLYNIPGTISTSLLYPSLFNLQYNDYAKITGWIILFFSINYLTIRQKKMGLPK